MYFVDYSPETFKTTDKHKQRRLTTQSIIADALPIGTVQPVDSSETSLPTITTSIHYRNTVDDNDDGSSISTASLSTLSNSTFSASSSSSSSSSSFLTPSESDMYEMLTKQLETLVSSPRRRVPFNAVDEQRIVNLYQSTRSRMSYRKLATMASNLLDRPVSSRVVSRIIRLRSIKKHE